MQPRILVTIFVLSLSLSPTVLLGQQEQLSQEHEAHHPEGATSTDETTASDQTSMEASSDEKDEKTEAKDSINPSLASMQQRMEEMLSHWDKMSQTTDPAQRRQLMLEHRQKMMALNAAMRDMARRQGMMSKGQGGGMMGGQGMSMMGGQGMSMMGGQGMSMMGRHGGSSSCQAGWLEAYRQLEKRVDLLQKMVEEAMRE